METHTTSIYREPRPNKRTQERCMRGTGGRASTIWHDRYIARMTPHQIAHNRDLPEWPCWKPWRIARTTGTCSAPTKDAERARLAAQGFFVEDSPAQR